MDADPASGPANDERGGKFPIEQMSTHLRCPRVRDYRQVSLWWVGLEIEFAF